MNDRRSTGSRVPARASSPRLDPAHLANPDTDLRQVLPDLLISWTQGLLVDGGCDYVDNVLLLFLETQDLDSALPLILSRLASERILGNDLSQIPVAVEQDDTLNLRHPTNFTGRFHYKPRITSRPSV